MVDKKPDEPVGASDIIQRYRFRVRTAGGRELVSHVATVTRPAPPAALSPEPALEAALLPQVAREVALKQPPAKEAASVVRVDVPVHRILVSVQGAKQGAFKADPVGGDVPGEAPTHLFEINEFAYAVKSPRDPQSGLPTGQRMHDPVVFVKALSASSPQLHAALAANETLPVVIFDCYGPSKTNQYVLAHTVKLSNASIASIDFEKPNMRDPALMKYGETQRIALTFQTAELIGPGNVTAMDDLAQE